MKRETIDKFLYHKVTLTDCNGIVMSGYFVPHAKKYKLFPENSGWDTYVYRPSHISKLETTSKAKQQPSIRPMPKKKGNKKVGKELLEKASKVKSVGNTMCQFDIYLDEFIEKENNELHQDRRWTHLRRKQNRPLHIVGDKGSPDLRRNRTTPGMLHTQGWE